MKINRVSALMWPVFNYRRHLPPLGKVKVPLIVFPDTAFDVFINTDLRLNRDGEGIKYYLKKRRN